MTGTSVRDADDVLETADAPDVLPATEAAARRGALRGANGRRHERGKGQSRGRGLAARHGGVLPRWRSSSWYLRAPADVVRAQKACWSQASASRRLRA